MKLFPAIDIIDGQVVRPLKGQYDQKTVYSSSPLSVALEFKSAGAEYLHVVDLDGAKAGDNPNFSVIKELIQNSGLSVEIGGGIRDEKAVVRYLESGAMRVILGSAAFEDPTFTESMINKYNEKIAIGVDLNNGKVATRGWLNVTDTDGFDFCSWLENIGVRTVICTDISKDGAMRGTNLELYQELSDKSSFDIVASGGISTLNDIKSLLSIGIEGYR